MTTKTNKKKKIEEIVIARAISILAVLMVHSTSVTVVTLLPDSSSFSFYNAVNTFFRFGTPTFILLSSLVLFYSYYHRPLTKERIKRFYSNRLMYILVPYVLFSFIYIYVNSNYFANFASSSDFWATFIDKLSLGKAHPHLYFVFISVQFYLMFPLFLYLLKRWPAWTKHLIWLGFVIQWAYVLGNHYFWKYENTGSISLSYMSYYLTGAFIGIYYTEIKTWAKSRSWAPALIVASWVAAVGFHLYVWHSTRVWGIGFDSKLYSFAWNIHTFTTALVVLLASSWIIKKAPTALNRILILIGNLSFGIYLIHPLFLKYYRMYITPGGNMTFYHLFIAGSFIGALVISGIIVYLALYKWRWGWILFGASPKEKKR